MSRNQCIELSHLQSFANFVSYSDIPAEFHWFLKWSRTNVKKKPIMPTLYFFSRALHVEHYQIYELCSHKRNFFLDTTGPHWGKILENASCLFLRRYFSRVTVCHGGGEMKSTFASLWNKFLRLEGLNLIDHPQPQFHKMFTFSHFIREAFKNYLADFFR